MKKLLAMLLAMVLCFGACAVAEDEEWKDYASIIMGVMYESTEEVLAEDASRVVSMACAVLDYAVAEPVPYSIGGGDTYYVMGDGDITLFCCPLMENDDKMQSAVILYDFVEKVYSVRVTVLPVKDLVEALSETTGIPYAMSNQSVADAAETLLEAIMSED